MAAICVCRLAVCCPRANGPKNSAFQGLLVCCSLLQMQLLTPAIAMILSHPCPHYQQSVCCVPVCQSTVVWALPSSPWFSPTSLVAFVKDPLSSQSHLPT